MADVSISQLIILIVSLSIAVSIGGVVLQSTEVISGSIKEKRSRLSKQIETDFKIINDPEYMTENVNNENRVVLYVKNTGSSTLGSDGGLIDVFIDGGFLTPDNLVSTEVVDGRDWIPSRVLRIETSYTESYLGPGDHKVKVVIFNTEDTVKFRLERGK